MKKRFILLLFAAAVFVFMYCDTPLPGGNEVGEEWFLNFHDTVDYVGMETCRTCHPNVYDTYIETGMGRSFDHATLTKSAANFDSEHALVYDEDLDFYYKPYWQDSVLYFMEFRLDGKDTVHKRIERIDYIIGSGQHTNSHLINRNGYVYQAPITYYTQDGRWDLAPGFEDGANTRFTRIIATECMTCHNHLPIQEEGSENKYAEVPTGIECERCHGPGELHVNEKMAGNIIDTSKYVDYSIVNPAHLPAELEVDLCQRCHLQGVAVLKEGKSFFDFRPGMELDEVMNVFLPRYTDSHERFIMASQADRMRLSDCFTIGKMTCTTCHNPHKSIESTDQSQYTNACFGCHQKSPEDVCSAPMAKRLENGNDCISCHMPKTGSIDIPHVRITDHYITKPIEKEESKEIARFIGLECLTKEDASPLEMAQGYLALYDKFVPELEMLDSAKAYLNKSAEPPAVKLSTAVHYAFNRGNYQEIIRLAEASLDAELDGWTAYRVGEAYLKVNLPDKAVDHLIKATSVKPKNLDFQNKLGVALLKLQRYPEAKRVYEFILSENPDREVELTNLGFIFLMEKNIYKAEELYDKALALNPDYEQAWLNKIGLMIFKNEPVKAKSMVDQFVSKFPDNQQGKMLKQQLAAY